MADRATLRQRKHVLRGLEDALDKLKLDREGFQRLAERGGVFHEQFQALVRKCSAPPTTMEIAKKVLGRDLITPEEVANSRGLNYAKEHLQRFERTLPDHETLLWLCANEFVLLPGPPKEMTLLGVRELNPTYFTEQTGGSFAKDGEVFAREETVRCQWYAIHKTCVRKSVRKNWIDGCGELAETEVVPRAVTLVWATTTHKAVRGEYLLRGLTRVRTASVSSNGDHVTVDCHRFSGVSIEPRADDLKDSRLGVSGQREL